MSIVVDIPEEVEAQFKAFGISVVRPIHLLGQGAYSSVRLAINDINKEALAIKGPVSEREVSLAFVAAEDGVGAPTYGEPIQYGKDKLGNDTYYYASLKLEASLDQWPKDPQTGKLKNRRDCVMLLELARASIENGYVHGDLWIHCKNVMKTAHHALLIDFMTTRKLPPSDYSYALGQAEWATLFTKCGVPQVYLVNLLESIHKWRWDELTANMPPLTPLEVPAARRGVVFSQPAVQPPPPPPAPLGPVRQLPPVNNDDDNDVPDVVNSGNSLRVDLDAFVPEPTKKQRRIQ